MKLNVKFLGIALVLLVVGGAYWLGSYLTTAQLSPPSQTQTIDPMVRVATALERMASAMEGMRTLGSGGMGMMGGAGMMGQTGQRDSMMQGTPMMEEQDQMGQMMQSCQQMMGQDEMASPTTQPQPTAPAGQLTQADLTRTTSGAAITVAATFLNPTQKPEADQLVFQIALDTHSVDLLQYDLTKLAVLRTSEGLAVTQGFTWEPQEESSHHRAGLLKVAASLAGKPLITQDTKYLELELKDIGIPSRLFKWEEAFLGKEGS